MKHTHRRFRLRCLDSLALAERYGLGIKRKKRVCDGFTVTATPASVLPVSYRRSYGAVEKIDLVGVKRGEGYIRCLGHGSRWKRVVCRTIYIGQ